MTTPERRNPAAQRHVAFLANVTGACFDLAILDETRRALVFRGHFIGPPDARLPGLIESHVSCPEDYAS